MAEYPWNSVLHNACELFVTEVIESEEEALKLSLFTQDRLYWSLRRRIRGGDEGEVGMEWL